MAAFAAEYHAPPGWSVDGLALMAARSAVERAALACARSRLDGDDWVGALDLLSADTLAPYASVELECGAADVAWADGVVVVARDDGHLGFHNWQTGAAVAAPVVAHAGSVRAVARSGHRTVASTGDDGVVRRWDLREGSQLVHEHHGHTDGCGAIAWWDATDTLASGGRDGTVRIWDGRAPRAAAISRFGSDVRALAPAGHAGIGLVVGLGDGSLELWDVRQGAVPARCQTCRFAPGAGVGALAESTWVDTPRVAAGADDGSIRLVYVDAPAVGGHADYCNALCWTDASTLVSGGRDGVVRSWRV